MNAIISTLKNALFKKIQGSPGLSQQVDLRSIGDGTDDAEVYHPAGFYSRSIDGVIGVVIDAGDNNIVVATHNYNFEKDVDKGEALIYSIDINGNIKASAKVDKDGNFVVNDGTKSAVAFAELKTQFDELKTAFNSHTHTYAPGPGSPVPTGPSTPQSAADLTGAEVDKVKLP